MSAPVANREPDPPEEIPISSDESDSSDERPSTPPERTVIDGVTLYQGDGVLQWTTTEHGLRVTHRTAPRKDITDAWLTRTNTLILPDSSAAFRCTGFTRARSIDLSPEEFEKLAFVVRATESLRSVAQNKRTREW